MLKFKILFNEPFPPIRRISPSEILRPQPFMNPFGIVGPACQTLLFLGKYSLVVGDSDPPKM